MGGLPKGHRDAYANPPSRWDEIVNNQTKNIVFVSEGTLTAIFMDLVIPTLTGLKGRDNTLVVVALGKKDRVLLEGTHVPANARIGNFILSDDISPYCSVFMSNCGYGALQHAAGYGIPLLIGGSTEDKPEMLLELSGLALRST